MNILQFGTGRFLRAFLAPLVSEPGSILVVQSRPDSGGADLINEIGPDGFHVWTRGLSGGERIDRAEQVRSLGRAVVAHDEWEVLEQTIADPGCELVVSNTTAAGLELDPNDAACPDQAVPRSFPARLARLLRHRFEQTAAPLTVLPLELVELNGTRLQGLVREVANSWDRLPEGFLDYLSGSVRWINNLVDRIVVRPTEPTPWSTPDPAAVAAEPYRLLALEDDGRGWGPIPRHEMITWTEDLTPYYLRKVRILNGLHTAMVARYLPRGFSTVRQCVTERESRVWLESLLEEEILPALQSRGVDGRAFAEQTWERFENPFMDHFLTDIANGHPTKLKIRLQPTMDEYMAAFQRSPVRLADLLSSPIPG